MILWTEEERDFLRRNVTGNSFKKLSGLHNEVFPETPRTEFACQRQCTKMGIGNGVDAHFKKGIRYESNINSKPIGTLQIARGYGKRGYDTVYIKIADNVHDVRGTGHSIGNDNNWMPYAQYIWELAYGEIPPNYIIVHLDGDSINNNIDNLAIIPMEVHAAMARGKLYFKDKNLTTAGILCATLDNELCKLKRNK